MNSQTKKKVKRIIFDCFCPFWPSFAQDSNNLIYQPTNLCNSFYPWEQKWAELPALASLLSFRMILGFPFRLLGICENEKNSINYSIFFKRYVILLKISSHFFQAYAVVKINVIFLCLPLPIQEQFVHKSVLMQYWLRQQSPPSKLHCWVFVSSLQ